MDRSVKVSVRSGPDRPCNPLRRKRSQHKDSIRTPSFKMRPPLTVAFILMQSFCLASNVRAAFAATPPSYKSSAADKFYRTLSFSQTKTGNVAPRTWTSPFFLRGGTGNRNIDPFVRPLSCAVMNEISDVAEKVLGYPITSNLAITTFASSIQHVNTTPLTTNGQHRVLFILGGPGAGKGTQCENICSHYKACHLSVGELLRDAEKTGSPHAPLIKECLVAGNIVPVEISLALLREAMDAASAPSSSSSEGETFGSRIFLVDGFPRNFDNLLGWCKSMPQYAALLGSLIFDCPQDELERRILSRGLTSGRSDDNIESARKRFQTFEGQTVPVVKSLEEVEKKDGGILKVVHLQGQNSVDQVWEEVKEVVDVYVLGDVLSANQRLIQALNDRDYQAYKALCDYVVPDENEDTDTMDKEAQWKSMMKFEELEDMANVNPVRNVISNADAQIIKGTEAVVSYDRTIVAQDETVLSQMRETRVWHHGANGWMNVHFVRKPLE